MKPGLITQAFKRLEPYDGKLSSTVLRGRRNRQRFLCYPTLIYSFLFIASLDGAQAEDHKAWALQLQEKSKKYIEAYKNDPLVLKDSKEPFKGCRVSEGLSCPKKSKQTPVELSHTYIFVSFSMPKQTLKSLSLEAKKHNAVLVVRGLIDNSFVKTAKFLQEVGEGVILDPTLFKRYDVHVVPTFVKTHKNDFMRICGNVSLSYALEKFKEGVE